MLSRSPGATTSARAVSEWGAMNDTTKPSTPHAITGPAVCQVVAGRARRRGHHQPVAAHAAQLLVLQRVREVGDALANLAVDRHVVDRSLGATVEIEHDRGQAEQLEVALQRAANAIVASPRSTVARKPIAPKLIANTGTCVPVYSCSARRIVPSPPSTTAQLHVVLDRRVHL